jgi:hypothetical protein
VTKSWCNEGITKAIIKIPGYVMQPELRRDRTDTANEIVGGLLVYTRTGITVLTIDKGHAMDQYCSLRLVDGSSEVSAPSKNP